MSLTSQVGSIERSHAIKFPPDDGKFADLSNFLVKTLDNDPNKLKQKIFEDGAEKIVNNFLSKIEPDRTRRKQYKQFKTEMIQYIIMIFQFNFTINTNQINFSVGINIEPTHFQPSRSDAEVCWYREINDQLIRLKEELPNLDSDRRPFDIIVGFPEDPTINPFFNKYYSKQYPTLICLWTQGAPPSRNDSILRSNRLLHVSPNLNYRNIVIKEGPLDIKQTQTYFIEHYRLVVWVGWGTVDNNEINGWLVGVLQERIYFRDETPIPAYYDGYPVYQVTSRYQSAIGINSGNRVDCLKICDQIAPGDMEVGYGTLGAFIKDKHDNIYILSNQHVLKTNLISTDKRITQPDQGSIDGDEELNIDDITVAQYHNGIRDNFIIDNNAIGIDAALAKLTYKRPFKVEYRKTKYLRTNEFIPYQLPILTPKLLTKVYKCGATSGVTSGTITNQNQTVRIHAPLSFYSSIQMPPIVNNVNRTIDYPSVLLHNQILVSNSTKQGTNFIERGDSGSLVINEDGHPVGLAHGRMENFDYSIMTDLRSVMAYLATIVEEPQIIPYDPSTNQ